ncbi:MAG: hypothetical protein ABSC05_37915 [Candidatus Solibacter sp.]
MKRSPGRDQRSVCGGGVGAWRGVPIDQALNPKVQDSGVIKHHGPNPYYGPKRRAS